MIRQNLIFFFIFNLILIFKIQLNIELKIYKLQISFSHQRIFHCKCASKNARYQGLKNVNLYIVFEPDNFTLVITFDCIEKDANS